MAHEHEKEHACGHCHEHEHSHEHKHEHERHHEHEHHHEHRHEHGHSHGHDHGHEHGGGENRGAVIVRLCVAAALLAAALFLLPEGWMKFAGFAAAYLVIGYDVILRAVSNVIHGDVFDECFLMTVASIGAFAVGEQAEGVAVMLLYQLGELLEDLASDRTRDAIEALADVRPDTANLEENGAVNTVEARNVPVGAVIVIKPGERVPLDGTVLDGESELDQSALTGEALPRPVRAGDTALSGCVNLRGVLRLRVEKDYGDSEVARVLELVESASERKSRSEQFITRFARIYTPAVCLLALLIAVIPPLFLGGWSEWIRRALLFLVISCPCALVISVPLTFFAGIGALSRRGVLVKGSSYMDRLAEAETVVFDKTGTLTTGQFRVAEVRGSMERDELIELTALAERWSDHPLAKAVLDAYGRDPDRGRVFDAEELAGRGVRAVVDGRKVLAGNARLMAEQGIEIEEMAGTVLYVAVDGRFAGGIALEDQVKDGAAEAVAQLKKLGVKNCVMLTGDAEEAAARVARETGMTEYAANLLPGGKVERIEGLLREKSERGALVFVGDGINDAPALALSDVGIAMGAMGSEAAIEAADVVLMDDRPGKLALAVTGSRRTLRIARENIALSLAVKLIVMALGAAGLAGMWAAVFADVGVCLLAILNASRAMRPGK